MTCCLSVCCKGKPLNLRRHTATRSGRYVQYIRTYDTYRVKREIAIWMRSRRHPEVKKKKKKKTEETRERQNKQHQGTYLWIPHWSPTWVLSQQQLVYISSSLSTRADIADGDAEFSTIRGRNDVKDMTNVFELGDGTQVEAVQREREAWMRMSWGLASAFDRYLITTWNTKWYSFKLSWAFFFFFKKKKKKIFPPPRKIGFAHENWNVFRGI